MLVVMGFKLVLLLFEEGSVVLMVEEDIFVRCLGVILFLLILLCFFWFYVFRRIKDDVFWVCFGVKIFFFKEKILVFLKSFLFYLIVVVVISLMMLNYLFCMESLF